MRGKTYVYFNGKTEYIGTGGEEQTAYPLGSLVFGTLDVDWEPYLEHARAAAPRLYRRGFRRNLHDAAAAVRAGDLCVLSGRGVLSQYVPECQDRFSGIL